MIANMVDKIKRVMGWCPQKDFGFIQAGDTKHSGMHDFCAGYGNMQKKRREKVLVDLPFLDSGMIRILLPVGIVGLMLTIMSAIIFNHYSILDIFIVLAYYLALLLLVLQNRTTVELAHSTIIIHRPFLRSIVIQKNEVTKIQVIKNFAHKTRWIVRPVALILLIFLATHNINAIYLNIEKTLPMLVTIVNIFPMPLITVMCAVIFYSFEIRTHYQSILNVTINKRQVAFYVDNPDELCMMLQHTGEVTLDG